MSLAGSSSPLTSIIGTMLFRYSQSDGSQSIDPFTEYELLDLIPSDLIDEAYLRRALDQDARQAFQELIDELRQKMLGDQMQRMMEGMQRLTPEDLGPVREMVRELNQLLAKHARGAATEEDFRDFMQRFGEFFPDGINSIDELVEYLEQQAAMMSSLL